MIREAHIKAVLNGYIVTIGCQTVVFPSPAALASAICEYYTEPTETEKRYRETALNKALLNDATPNAPTERTHLATSYGSSGGLTLGSQAAANQPAANQPR
jgi:hypothetical protein